MTQLSVLSHGRPLAPELIGLALRATRHVLKSAALRALAHAPVSINVAARAMKKYRYTFGYWPNILFPGTFNEKLQARKIFDRRPILALWADKLAVRTYVVDKTSDPSLLPRLLHVTTDPTDIPFDRLPSRYVVKASHGSGWVHIVQDGAAVDSRAVIETCRQWLALNYYDINQEPLYRRITPRILIEEFLDDGTGEPPDDYKFYVFGGKVRFIQVDMARFGQPPFRHQRNIYDPNWTLLPVTLTVEPYPGTLERPPALDRMIQIAETLADATDFVRVDLYAVNDTVYFGEMTPSSGNGFNKFSPVSYDQVFGSFWTG
ncbi:ATP-grasp fold amidoligase family protein [Lichenicoccus sp.]|uniref:ATP-grasp fold amidoligase family protein n=1 Tax=Lichenicoccus sp. TaxID=2781899 RepID=UPI003D0C7609